VAGERDVPDHTVLFLAVARWRWHWPTWKLATGAAIFVPIEGTFLAANLSKVHTAAGCRSSSPAASTCS
jgi:K+ transporter